MTTIDLPNSLGREPGSLEPVRVSWSSLKRWEMCRQLQLRVIQQAAPKGDGRNFLPGTVVDKVQTRWLSQDQTPTMGQMERWVPEVLEHHSGPGAEYRIKWRGSERADKKVILEDCVEAVRRLEPILEEKVLPFDYQPALRFRAHLMLPYVREGVKAPTTMQGEFDIVVRDNDGRWRIYDLKMTRDKSYISSSIGQLIFYNVSWSVIQGEPLSDMELGFIAPMLEGDQFIPCVVDNQDRSTMMSRVIQYVSGVWADEWDPKASDSGCKWCDARKTCLKYRDVSIIDENGKQKTSFAAAAAQRRAFRDQGRTGTS